jgi:predicted RNase H-like HicB family nuclease
MERLGRATWPVKPRGSGRALREAAEIQLDRHSCGWSPRFRAARVVSATPSCHAETTRKLATHWPRRGNSLGGCGRRYFGSHPSRVVTTRYELIIYWSKEDDSFVVEVPELPGCMADGQTYAEAVANAEFVIDEWIAVTQRNRARPGFQTAHKLGRPIPEPRGPARREATNHIG